MSILIIPVALIIAIVIFRNISSGNQKKGAVNFSAGLLPDWFHYLASVFWL